MTTEEKLKYFEESSLEEARKQASAMIEEYKVNLDKVEKELIVLEENGEEHEL